MDNRDLLGLGGVKQIGLVTSLERKGIKLDLVGLCEDK